MIRRAWARALDRAWVTSRPLLFGLAIGLVLLFVLAATGWALVSAHKAQSRVTRITQIVEGTPGKNGKPGKPGIGVEAVIVHSLAPGSDPRANLNHGLLRLWLPTGMPGPRGARGPAGRDGRPGRNGQPGRSISMRQLRAAVNAFLRSHTLRCRRDGHVLVCRIAN